MSVSADYNLKITVDETLALGMDHVTDPVVAHNVGVVSGTLTASSTVPATKVFSDTVALVAGAKTLELTALAGPLASTIDMTGLKVQLVQITNPAGNDAAGLEIDVGLTDGYNLFGEDAAGTEQVILPPGSTICCYYADGLADVGASEDQVDFTGTLVEEFQITLVAG